jgi:sugar lactone lactonase YvrE
VAEVGKDGARTPFPDATWNSWKPGEDGAARWVCVQSVTVDAKDRLWVLDPASPRMEGVVPGAAKLVAFDLGKPDAPPRTIRFDEGVAPSRSYLNDVRVDVRRETAFVTDSGLGAIVVVDLATGKARRRLADHASTKAEPGVVPKVEGKELKVWKDGKPETPRVHSDGIALDPAGTWLWWQALTGKRLHRVRVASLLDAAKSEADLSKEVEDLGETVVTDGMEADRKGGVWFTAVERGAIAVRRADGAVDVVASDPRLAWPDSLAWGPDGSLFVCVSQLHRSPLAWPHERNPETPFLLLRLVFGDPAGR